MMNKKTNDAAGRLRLIDLWHALLLVIVCVFALSRFQVPTTELTWAGAYKDAAHGFVGLLIGITLGGWFGRDWLPLTMAAALTVVEIVAFLGPKFGWF